MPNLTSSQIQQIFDFTAQKYIKYYDVKLELVDHIANRIEEMQAEDPKLSFDSALQRVYKSFGIYGFTKVQEQKMIELQRYWRMRFWSYIKSYFKLPKVILTICLTLLIMIFLNHGIFYVMLDGISERLLMLIRTVASIGLSGFAWYTRKTIIKSSEKLLSVDAFLGATLVFFWMPLYFSIDLICCLPLLPWYIIAGFSLFIVLTIILFHALIFVFPDHIT